MQYTVVASGLPAGNIWTGNGDLQCTGTNDHTKIQQAIDAVASWGGGTVELSAGEFLLNGTINLKNGVSLVGQGPATVTNPALGDAATILRYLPSSGNAIMCNPPSGQRYANLSLGGFHLVAASPSAYGLVLEATSGLELTRLGISGFRSGLILRSVWDSRIDLTRIDNCGAAGGDPATVIESTTADGDANSLRFNDCTWESSKGSDLLIRDNGGGRPNKLVFRSCKFEQIDVRDDRIVVTSADYLVFDACNFYTGSSLAGGSRINVLSVSGAVDVRLRDLRMESEGTAPTLNSWIRFAGDNNGAVIDGVLFQTGSTSNPLASSGAIVFAGTNERFHLGANGVIWAGGGTPAFPLVKGTPTSTL